MMYDTVLNGRCKQKWYTDYTEGHGLGCYTGSGVRLQLKPPLLGRAIGYRAQYRSYASEDIVITCVGR